MKRRFRIGRLATVFSLNVVATSLRSVFSSGVPALTSTVSLSSPSCSLTLRLVSWSTDTLDVLHVRAEARRLPRAPGIGPTIRNRCVKKPDSLVVVVKLTARFVSVMVTFAFGRPAPD